MNKELIKKYKTEFDHWLNGGDILVKFTNYGWVNSLSFNWGSNDLDCDIKYIVINDEYVELRKASAEGKTIEARSNFSSKIYYEVILPVWFDLPVNFYRIKPEEPQFKVGDWVVHNDVIGFVYTVCKDTLKICVHGNPVISGWYEPKDLKHWKPKPGELVIMETDDYSSGFTVTPWEENSKFSPVPFIGELPK